MAAQTTPDWSIVSFVKDTPKNIRLFVSYHLGIGAAHMHLFFDDPDDPCIPMLSHLERVTTYACDEDFWREVAGKPKFHRHGMRQNITSTFGYKAVTEGWVLHLDSDEFLHGPKANPVGYLADIPDEKLAVRLMPAEQVHVPSDAGKSYFRLPMSKHDVKDIHGDFAWSLIRRQGFFGHLDGKSFTRSGVEGVSLKPHWPHWDDGSLLDFAEIPASAQQCILHRNAETLDRWLEKLEFRLTTASIPGRLRDVLMDLVDAEDAMGLCEIHKKIFSVSAEQHTKMEAIAAIFALKDPIDRFLTDYFPDLS